MQITWAEGLTSRLYFCLRTLLYTTRSLAARRRYAVDMTPKERSAGRGGYGWDRVRVRVRVGDRV